MFDSDMEKTFDLNIENVLENWEIHHAIREIIANALDEMVITNTEQINISRDSSGFWHIRDYGRGLKYKHFTQNESDEKATHNNVIGKFGVGLKDALAVFYRHGISVKIYTSHGDISLEMIEKDGFSDIKTLNAIIRKPSNPNLVGTDFVINVKDIDVEKAKSMFLYFSGESPIESNTYGEIYEKPFGRTIAYVYVHGVKVSEEENYLFDYNITKTNSALNKALNRERSNVGRSAYSDIVKKMVLSSESKTVIDTLIDEVKDFGSGEQSDEAQLTDIQVHAIKVYNQQNDIVVLSSYDAYEMSTSDKEIIEDTGRKILIVPDNVFNKVRNDKDYNGREIGTLDVAKKEYNNSFSYDFVKHEDLDEQEKEIFELKKIVFKYYGNKKYEDKVYISNNINEMVSGDTLGVFDTSLDSIIIKRSQLCNIELFSEILFHELVHATSGANDNTRYFENEQGKIIGMLFKLLMEKKDCESEQIYINENLETKKDVKNYGELNVSNIEPKISSERINEHNDKQILKTENINFDSIQFQDEQTNFTGESMKNHIAETEKNDEIEKIELLIKKNNDYLDRMEGILKKEELRAQKLMELNQKEQKKLDEMQKKINNDKSLYDKNEKKRDRLLKKIIDIFQEN